jgi:hypothetical protein
MSRGELRDCDARRHKARRIFVIVDDVLASDAVQAFSIHADGSAILLTSRRARDFELSGISVTNIELLNELEADELFRAYANIADNVALDELQRRILGHVIAMPARRSSSVSTESAGIACRILK